VLQPSLLSYRSSVSVMQIWGFFFFNSNFLLLFLYLRLIKTAILLIFKELFFNPI